MVLRGTGGLCVEQAKEEEEEEEEEDAKEVKSRLDARAHGKVFSRCTILYYGSIKS